MDSAGADPAYASIGQVLGQLGAAALVDRRGRPQYVTEEACSLAGYGREELLGLEFSGLVPQSRSARWGALWRTVRTQGPRTLETQLRTRDGRMVPVEIHLRCFEWESESFLLCLARDADASGRKLTALMRGESAPPENERQLRDTERRKLELSLASREREFRTLAENLPDNVVRYDAAGTISYANPAVCRTVGKSVTQLVGRGLDGMPDTEWARAFKTRITARPANDGPDEIKIRIRAASGEEQIHLIRFVTERDEHGDVTGTLAIGRDVTEMERASSLLHARAEEFRALVENSPDTIARYDSQGRLVYINTATSGALCGETARQASPVDLARIIRNVLRLGKTFEGEVPYLTDEGEERWEHLRVVPEFGPDGKVMSALAVGHDITHRKEMEQRLEQSRAELRALVARRETAREEERKRVARELHDGLGQMLLALRMEIKVAERRADTDGVQARSGRMLELLDQTSRVIRDVVSALRPAAIDEGLVAAMEWLIADFSARTEIACSLDLVERDVRLEEERAVALFRILQESLTNIARHAGATRVLVRFERTGLDYRLSVRDNGRGFDASRQRKKSFGLVGMRERALAIGGTLAVSTAPDAGTDVVVLIPMRRSANQ